MKISLRKLLSPLNTKILVRNNFLVNCIVLTLLSVLVAVGSSRFLFKYELPKENFVTLEIIGSIDILCDDSNIFDTGGNFILDDCKDQTYSVYQTRASGGVLSRVGNKTYVLTADHFCDTSDISQMVPEGLEDYISISRKIRKDGRVYDFTIEKQNKEKDLCLISSEGYPVDGNLKLARSMPEVGEITTTISSPLGVSENGVNLHFSGTFSGCNSFTCFFTIPAISGSSGSLVLNYDKEIVGMTQRSLVGFPEVTIGVGIYDITDFVREFESESGIDITP